MTGISRIDPAREDLPASTPPASAPTHDRIKERILARATDADTALESLLGATKERPADTSRSADSSELIHDYRVALRRLRSIVRLLDPAFSKKKMRAIADRIKAAAEITGDLRDEEVLRETLSDLSVESSVAEPLGRWMRGRARRENGQRVRVTRAIRETIPGQPASIRDALGDLRARLAAPPKRPLSDIELATHGLRRAMARVRERARDLDARDAAAMHRLRIAFKKLRYTLETIEGIVGPTGWEPRAAAVAAKMQKHLGRLHDLDEALVRMGRARGLEHEPRREVVQALEKERHKAGHKCEREAKSALAELDAMVSFMGEAT